MIKITDKIVNLIPEKKFNGGNGEKFIKWFGKHISTPENRVIIGVTALLSQPFIDYYNKDVDEKTRKVSCARTIAKIVAGTLTGFAVRASFIKLVRNYSQLGNSSAVKKFFTPSNAKTDMPYAYRQYQNTMGMMFAIAGLIVTGFAIDAPLTNFLTNTLTKNIENKSLKGGKSSKGGNNETN